MKLIVEIKVQRFPKGISTEEALNFHRMEVRKHNILMVMAAHWRECPEQGEEDWFEELTADELDDEDFIEDFRTATLQLWMR